MLTKIDFFVVCWRSQLCVGGIIIDVVVFFCLEIFFLVPPSILVV
jgi:hypothetical protein